MCSLNWDPWSNQWVSLLFTDVPTPAWCKIRPTGPTITVPPPSPGWFCWAWCSTWLLLLQVRDQITTVFLSEIHYNVTDSNFLFRSDKSCHFPFMFQPGQDAHLSLFIISWAFNCLTVSSANEVCLLINAKMDEKGSKTNISTSSCYLAQSLCSGDQVVQLWVWDHTCTRPS